MPRARPVSKRRISAAVEGAVEAGLVIGRIEIDSAGNIVLVTGIEKKDSVKPKPDPTKDRQIVL